MSNDIKPQHILDAAKVATRRVLSRCPALWWYRDEVESESLVAATKAVSRYPTVGLLFSYGLRYITDRIIRAMKVQGWLWTPGRPTVTAWGVLRKYPKERSYIPYDNTTDDELKSGMALVLNKRATDILWRRIVEEEDLQSIGNSYNLSRQAVWQAVNSGRDKLRRAWASQDETKTKEKLL